MEAATWVCPKCGRSFKNTEQDHYCGKLPAMIEEYIAARLTEYKTSKGAIQLPYSKPISLELIGEIAKWCKENSRSILLCNFCVLTELLSGYSS